MRLAINIPQIDTFSDEEFYRFCRANPDLRVERNENGQIVVMPPTGIETSFRNSDLNYRIYSWNLRNRLGRVSDSNGGYTLPDSSMRAPDVAWISNERLATIPLSDLKKFAHVCPDFVIELMSESDEMEDLEQKMKKWLVNGVRLGWLVDPKKRQTYIFSPVREPEVKLFSDDLLGEEVLPGLVIKLSDIF
ncbi:Uma2 family endonuclease [Dyadobacter psychrotolerans]|uniref:Uma2 family endonuclease n=1 Tax=Dyadobacter psychrotolerans TaxID=2541721 RepID=A0A4V6PFQ4_9BACT|nr:Uma2 family endonuclease [Dyadobacter psychrotolerans]TDE12408.1 Uma2 family endonuclease [Dyadobacter psychrotolerans]